MTDASAPRPRCRLRWVLLAGLPLLMAVLWWRLPPRTGEEFRDSVQPWPVCPVTSVRLGAGDDARWADPAFDDSAWPAANLSRLPWSDGVFWLRIHLNIARPDDPALQQFKQKIFGLRRGVIERIERLGVNALEVEALCAQEVFWQGRLIGGSGTPGRRPATEEPGANHSYYALPTGLTAPGSYVLAVRLSHQRAPHRPPYFTYNPSVGRFEDLVTRTWFYGLGSMGIMAAGLVGAAFCLVAWWLIERRSAFAVFAAFCLTAGVIGGLYIVREIGFVQYPGYWALLLAGGGLNLAAGALLLGSAVLFLALPRPLWWMLLAAPPLALTPALHVYYFLDGKWPLQWYYAATLLLAAAGWSRRRWGAGWVAAAAVVPWTADLLGQQRFAGNFSDPWNAALMVLFSVGLFRSIGLTLRSEQLRVRQGQLTSARLETELLKRNIQPHFLLNSLGSIAQFVEENPAVASRMIEALADEFRIVSRVSQRQLIPLSEEIELCEAHLRVMSLRREARYRLETALIDPAALIPPALLHTLVENAITHGGPAHGYERVLQLVETHRTDGRRVLELHSPVTATGADRHSAEAGTGTRYVKARLEESFPGRWHFEAGPVPGGWRARIEFTPEQVSAGAA